MNQSQENCARDHCNEGKKIKEGQSLVLMVLACAFYQIFYYRQNGKTQKKATYKETDETIELAYKNLFIQSVEEGTSTE